MLPSWFLPQAFRGAVWPSPQQAASRYLQPIHFDFTLCNENRKEVSVYRDTYLQCSFFFLDKRSAIIRIFCSITDMKSEDFTFPRLDSNEAVSRCAADGSALARGSTQVFYFTFCASQHKIQSSGSWDPCLVLKSRNLPRFLSHYQKRLQLYL